MILRREALSENLIRLVATEPESVVPAGNLFEPYWNRRLSYPQRAR